MAVFENTEKLYDTLGTLFETLLNDPVSGPKWKAAQLAIKFNVFEPAGTIWLTPAGEVILGQTEELKPSVEMTLSGDSCHEFWMRQISLPIALAKGKIKAKGSMPTVLKLLPILKPAYEAYPDIARQKGIEDA